MYAVHPPSAQRMGWSAAEIRSHLASLRGRLSAPPRPPLLILDQAAEEEDETATRGARKGA